MQVHKTDDIINLHEQVLFVRSFQSHVHGTAESKKHDHKHNAEATDVPIDYLGKGLRVQTGCPGNK